MQEYFLTAVSVLLLGFSSVAQNSVAQNKEPLPSSAEIKLTFSTDGNRHQFYLGELIPVKFSYIATTPGRYIFVSENTKLAGGHGLDIACSGSAEPVRRSPLLTAADDKFGKMLNACGGFGIGGGIGSGTGDGDGEYPLSETAINFGPIALNRYVRFRSSGAYSCIASSADVTTTLKDEKTRPALLVKSNPLDLTLLDDPAWARSAAISYADAYAKLCRGDDVLEHHSLQCFDVAERLAYLDTPESLSAEVKFFDGKNHGWDNGFWDAIQTSSYPADAVRLMTDRIQDPDVEVSISILNWLASQDLRIESPDAFETDSPAIYHSQAVDKVRKFVRLLGSSLSKKNPDVRAEGAKTYSFFAEQKYCEGQPLITKEEQSAIEPQ
jgi:hypothetical protein